MKRRRFPLTQEDTHLWKRIADSTTPLSKQRGQLLKDEMAKLMDQTHLGSSPPTVSPRPKLTSYRIPQPQPHAPSAPTAFNSHPIEEHIAKKLAKGRLPIDSRIDLHGMTQDRARFALLDFLQMSQRADYRIILVITGKGNDGQGVLRQNVPNWLGLPEFSSMINGFRTSHISHGGDGALYVRLRKPKSKMSR
ncbi:MAG: Smr/MutS family protein [Rhizobiaceae bacterium]